MNKSILAHFDDLRRVEKVRARNDRRKAREAARARYPEFDRRRLMASSVEEIGKDIAAMNARAVPVPPIYHECLSALSQTRRSAGYDKPDMLVI